MINIDQINRIRPNSEYKLNDNRVIVWHPSWLIDIMTMNK